MVEPHLKGIPVSVQADLLGINRTSLYYKPSKPSAEDLANKAAIDKLYTKHPEFGYRRITIWLRKYEGLMINHKSVLKHMREMGIQAIYSRPDTSRPNPANKVYPYLLKGMDISKPDQVWSIDITYIPIRRSWLYLVAILDWYSRYVIEWMVDDTLEMDFVLATCENALKKSTPVIMNSDQGSHFTSPRYTKLFLEAGSQISMDHRGRAYDNIFIERLWRTVKYEDVYLKQYETPRDARIGIKEYMMYYNNERIHQSLCYRTPVEIYTNVNPDGYNIHDSGALPLAVPL
jgi:putative transposase